MLGDSWLLSNGSVAYYGHAGSRNGAYYFGFAMDKDFNTVCLHLSTDFISVIILGYLLWNIVERFLHFSGSG